jgi:hypothetical protein
MKCKLLKKSVNLVLVLAFFVSSSFAERPVSMDYRLRMKFKELQEKCSDIRTPAYLTTIEISFYAKNRDSNNIDFTFFHTHGIQYYTSQSIVNAQVPVHLIQEMTEVITGVDYMDLPNLASHH